MMRNPSAGILLIATSKKHLAEAGLCVRSIRRHTEIPITLCTPYQTDLPVAVVKTPNYSQSFLDKVHYIRSSPYERTLFLDTDTLVLRPDALEVLDVLDRFDMALAHAPIPDCGLVKLSDMPASFPELNTGVIGFKRSSTVDALLGAWMDLYEQHLKEHRERPTSHFIHDQPALRKVLYDSPIRLAALPHVFNYRFSRDLRIGQLKSVRILHNRELQMRVSRDDGSVNLDRLAELAR